jgi:hypothetical protein
MAFVFVVYVILVGKLIVFMRNDSKGLYFMMSMDLPIELLGYTLFQWEESLHTISSEFTLSEQDYCLTLPGNYGSTEAIPINEEI